MPRPLLLLLLLHSLDIWLMQGHKTGMNAHTDGRQVEVVEQHGQMIVQAASRMKVELQVACGGQRQLAGAILFAEPQFQLQ